MGELDILALESAIRTAKSYNLPILVDWDNRKIVILSEKKPTMKQDGTRLVLSDGPAFHREILFETRGK